jgi:methionyl-tRNA formyltransferase
VFFGTPEWAVPSLEALVESDSEVVAVVTNPDRPAGRGMKLRSSPVKERALEAGIDVLQPERARDPELRERLAGIAPDAAVVVAYGKILPGPLLDIPPLGYFNLHFSMLPESRGAAPVQRALIDGRTATGVTVMLLTEGMDEGPVLAAQEEAIRPGDTARTLGDRLAAVGARLLVRTLSDYAAGGIAPSEQDHGRATYAPKVTAEEARIRWTDPARRIGDLVRGCNPEPGAWTTFRGTRLKVLETRPAPDGRLGPGEVAANDALQAGTGDTPLDLTEVQLAGKRAMTGAELARGLRPAPGERFE